MNTIKGTVVEILGPDLLQIEVAYVGKSNNREIDSLIKVRFSAISPPYTKGLEGEQLVQALNESILGAYVSANIGHPDYHGVCRGKISREGPTFRGKRRTH